MPASLATAVNKWAEKHVIVKSISSIMEERVRKDEVAFLESEYGWWELESKLPIKHQNWERLLLKHIFDSNKVRRGIFDIKKNRKTLKGAEILYVNAWKYPHCEQYIIANKKTQSTTRAFKYIVHNIETNPHCKGVKVNYSQSTITFPNGSTISALPQDAPGEAGANHFCVMFDECWGYRLETAHRMVEEFTIPPSQPEGYQLFTSYAGFEDESELLKDIYNQIFDGDDIPHDHVYQVKTDDFVWSNEDYETTEYPLYQTGGYLIWWSNGPTEGHPGQQYHTKKWFDDQKRNQRLKQYLRLCKNYWVAGTEESAIEDIWENCVKSSVIQVGDEKVPYVVPISLPRNVPLFGGLDGSYKNDHFAFASVYPHPQYGKLALGPWSVWKPKEMKTGKKLRSFRVGKEDEISERFDMATPMKFILDIHKKFWLYRLLYDPYQLHHMMTELDDAGVRTVECRQGNENMMRAAEDLFNVLNTNSLLLVDNDQLNVYAENAVAKDKDRGWVFNKPQGKAGRKIDFIIALAMAVMAAVQEYQKFANTGRGIFSQSEKIQQDFLRQPEVEFNKRVGIHTEGQNIFKQKDNFGQSGMDDFLNDLERIF